MLGEGKTIPEARLGISEQTYHRWRNQYGGMKADDAKRLKELERENRPLKRDRRRSGAREPGAEGDREGKLVGPARRRRAVAMLRDRLGVSERWACRVVGQHRSTQRYEPNPCRGRSGVARRAAQVLEAAAAVGVPPRAPSPAGAGLGGESQAGAAAVARGGAAGPAAQAQAPAARDSTVPAERLRAELLNVVDEFTREALRMLVERSIDDSRLRDELLDVEEFSCLAEAKVVISDWREDYHQRRPHSSLGMKTLAQFARDWTAENMPAAA